MASGYEKLEALAPAAVASPPSTLPQGWMVMQDPSGSGKPLYYNSATGQTSYARPVVRVLPPGWIKSQTPDGKTIFIHPETQQCSFTWPQEGQMAQLSRFTTTPGNMTASAKPALFRSQTVPSNMQQSSPLITINADAARKLIPGADPAYAAYQLSERNNARTLSQKFTSDLAHTTSAMKEASISGAAVATKSAIVVGQTLVSRRKMVKASKKMVIHTGALGVKTGRAVKGMMSEMVDAADKRGKYQPKVKPFVPYDGQAQVPGQVHAYEYQQHQQQQQQQPPPPQYMDMTSGPMVQQLSSSIPATATAPVPTKVPARRPVRPQSFSVHPPLPSQTTVNVQPTLNANVTVQAMAHPQTTLAAPVVSHSNPLSSTHAANNASEEGANEASPTKPSTAPDQPPQSPPLTQVTPGALTQSSTIANVQVPQSPPLITDPTSATVAPILGPANTQQVQPSQPSLSAPQQRPPIVSIQAQGTLAIGTPSGLPSYAQATGQTTMSPIINRPPRRPLPPSANAPPQRPVTVQRPPVSSGAMQPQASLQYDTSAHPSSVQYVCYPPGDTQYQIQQPVYADQTLYAPMQAVMNTPQPVIIEQNQTVIQQSSDGQDLMLAQMQMQMAQQSVTNQLLMQQNTDTQQMMLAQAQMASSQQPINIDQTVYVDQSQNVDVTNVQENNMTAYAEYNNTNDVTFASTDYGDINNTETTGEELVFIDEDAATGEYGEVDFEADATGGLCETDFGLDDTELCF